MVDIKTIGARRASGKHTSTRENAGYARRIVALAAVFCLLLVLAWPLTVRAAGPLVNDLAGVLNAGQKSALEQRAQQLSNEYDMDVVLMTTQDTQGRSARVTAEDFLVDEGYGRGSDLSAVLFLIDYDNGEIYIATHGKAIRYFTDARIQSMVDAARDADPRNNPNRTMQAFLDKAASYLASGIPSDQYNEPEKQPNRLSLTDALIGAGASGASGLGFFTATRKRYRGKAMPEVFTFRDHSMVNLPVAGDRLVNTWTTSRVRPPPSNSSGGSGSGRSSTHTGSGGRTFGGGGGKF